MIGRLFKRRAERKRLLPEGVRIYAIGDIHGRADLLDACFRKIDQHLREHPVIRPIQITIGDYVDRGPDSRGVLDLLWTRSQQSETVMIRGNHESAFMDFLRDATTLSEWARIGGLETLMSYGLKPTFSPSSAEQDKLAADLKSSLPAQHQALLQSLLPSFSCGGYFFTHAGVRPGIPLSEQSEHDLMWIRDEFLLYEAQFEKVIVHGHTPVREIDVRANRINIDTGAYATGRLSCMVFEGERAEPLS